MKDLKDIRILCLIISGILAYPLIDRLAEQYLTAEPAIEYTDPKMKAVNKYVGLRGKLNFRFRNAVKLDHLVKKASQKYNMPADLIRAVIITESAFKVGAKSHVGALGLMQLMPGTAKELGVRDIYNPEDNIEGGTQYLSSMIKRFGNLKLGIAAYNAGPGNVIKHEGIPPFDETQNYVVKVLHAQKLLSKQGNI